MEPYRIDRDFGFLLGDITRLLRRAFDERVRVIGLTRAQWRLVAQLLRHNGATPSELGKMLEIGRASIGETLDRLEAKGMVSLRADKRDLRVRRVYLTRKGRALAPQLAQTALKLYAQAFTDVSATQRRRLLATLAVIRRSVREGFRP